MNSKFFVAVFVAQDIEIAANKAILTNETIVLSIRPAPSNPIAAFEARVDFCGASCSHLRWMMSRAIAMMSPEKSVPFFCRPFRG